MAFETTALRLWKRLSPQDRLAAATAFWHEPPQEVVGTAIGVLIKARRLRPQVARALPEEAKARALATVLDPGETVAASLLVALHLGPRREMLKTFLDAAGLAHEEGILKDETDALVMVPEASARAGVKAVSTLPRAEVETYLNTLWLQDPERWATLEQSESWF